jgi:catechol 2,3-dioxygenase-like lactoylglutathione lyase family enzyme
MYGRTSRCWKLPTAKDDSCCRSSTRRRASATVGTSRRTRWVFRHVSLLVDDIDAVVCRLRAHGAELVGELERYEDIFRLCYVRGPEGIIVELAERLR